MFSMKKSRTKKDITITGRMAKWYNKNSLARLNELSKVCDIIAAKTKEEAKILEVAPGPGYLSIQLSKRGFCVTGVELSADFVRIEKENAAREKVSVDFKQGNASDLPLDDNMFDFVICMAAFKNFSQPQKALDEMYRVLKPQGIALVIDMDRENTKQDIEEAMKDYSEMRAFDKWFVQFSFKTFLKKGAYTRHEFEGFVANTKFGSHDIVKHGVGLQVWLYKNN